MEQVADALVFVSFGFFLGCVYCVILDMYISRKNKKDAHND